MKTEQDMPSVEATRRIAIFDEMMAKLDEQACCNFFKGMSEKERKIYSDRALLWLDVARALDPENELRWWQSLDLQFAPKSVQKLHRDREEAKKTAKSMPPNAVKPEAMALAQLAVLATCTLTEIKKRKTVTRTTRSSDILADRKPKWLPEFCDWLLEDPGIEWRKVRALEKQGILEPKLSTNYYRGFMLAATEADLREDTALIDRLWESIEDDGSMRLFMQRTEATSPRAVLDSSFQERWRLFNGVGEKWHSTFVNLTRDGLLDKSQLIRALMNVYVRLNLEHSDSKSAIIESRVEELHSGLELTQSEKLELVQNYIQLLTCRNSKVVAWALKCLQELVTAPHFPAEQICESVPVVFLLKGKEHATEALKLLKLIADSAPNMVQIVSYATAEGLSSESQEIQKRAITQLEKLKQKDERLIEIVASKMDGVAALHRARVQEFCGAVALAAPPKLAVVNSGSDDSSTIDEREIPERYRKVLGSEALSPVTFRGDDIPRLSEENKLELLATLDDLIFMVSQIVHGAYEQFTCDDVEKLIDGVARFGCERPADYDQRIQPIKTDATQSPWSSLDPIMGGIQRWLSGKSISPQPLSYDMRNECEKELLRRFGAISERAYAGKPTRLLSTPTHKGGWIDAHILVERVRELEDTGAGLPARRGILSIVKSSLGMPTSEPDVTDQALALLRLAPDGRTEALRALNAMNTNRSEFIQALRYALGASDITIGETAQLWVAAARARNPFFDDQAVNARHPNTGPDGACVARYQVAYKTVPDVPQKKNPYSFTFNMEKNFRMIQRSPELSSDGKFSRLLPVIRHHVRIVLYTATRLNDWERSIWPMNNDAFFVEGIERMVNHEGNDSSGRTNTIFMEALYDPDIAVSEMALLMLILGSTSKQANEHQVAVESLIAVVEDGRLGGKRWGAAMREVLGANALRAKGTWRGDEHSALVSVTRWGKALKPVSQASRYHAYVVAEALEELLQGDSTLAPKDISILFEVLLETLQQTSDKVRSEATRKYLSDYMTLHATTKGGKLCKQLLSLSQGAAYATNLAEIKRFSMDRKFERVERWERALPVPLLAKDG